MKVNWSSGWKLTRASSSSRLHEAVTTISSIYRLCNCGTKWLFPDLVFSISNKKTGIIRPHFTSYRNAVNLVEVINENVFNESTSSASLVRVHVEGFLSLRVPRKGANALQSTVVRDNWHLNILGEQKALSRIRLVSNWNESNIWRADGRKSSHKRRHDFIQISWDVLRRTTAGGDNRPSELTNLQR